MIENLYNTQKATEDQNRATFNNRRYMSRQNIQKSHMGVYKNNNNTFNDIKTQQKRIDELINNNKQSYLKSNQMAFKEVKDNEVNAKNSMNNNMRDTYKSVMDGYDSRINGVSDDAKRMASLNRQLEAEESKLLQNLQTTQNFEAHMIMELKKTDA